MIRLIVNADDLGAGPGRDRGIFRTFREGLVTSASMIANGPSFASAAREALACGLPVGVHLNLSDGGPLTGPIQGLTDSAGRFPGKEGLRRRLAGGTLSEVHIRRELQGQIERILDTGLRPDHLDSHQHFALFPSTCKLLIELALENGIPALRLPRPSEPASADPGGHLGGEMKLYRQLAPAAERMLLASPLFTPDGLWGMPQLNRLHEKTLTALLQSLPEGTWELMTHPGEFDEGDPFSGRERIEEMAALIADSPRETIAARGIELTSFGACACAS